jgi:hypothetical protein
MPRFASGKLALSGWHDQADAACRTGEPTLLCPATERKTGCPSMPYPWFKTNNDISGHLPLGG